MAGESFRTLFANRSERSSIRTHGIDPSDCCDLVIVRRIILAIAMPLTKTANVIIEINFFICECLLICVGRLSRVENGGGTGREEFLARAGIRCASN